ncbi:MAG: cation-transporting P-type ATPase [Streptomyces sp.]|nr:cation-transporting P-type ATPase [Streptomyces sp.]
MNQSGGEAVRVPGAGLLRAVARPALGVIGLPAGPGPEGRARVRTFEGRAHIAMRGLGADGGARAAAAAEAVEQRLKELSGVRWAAVNAVLGVVVIATEGDEPADEDTLQALIDVVEAVEETHGADGPLPSHPVSSELAGRAAWALATQAAALPFAVAGRLVSMSPLPVELASVITIIDTQPRLRRLVENAVGKRNAGLVIAGLNAAAQASAGGFLGLGVDAVRHALNTAELGAHRTAWSAAEPDLAGAPHHAGAAWEEPPPRETPLRDGPIERYADRAALVAAAAFAGGLAVTRRPGSALSAALAAIPKAPGLAREGFSATLGGALAHSGTIVHDPEALRLLDRIGVAVLDSSALTTGSYVLADLVALDEDAPGGRLAATAHRLFDPGRPDRVSRDGDWALGPVGRLGLRGRTGARVRARLERDGAAHVLGLAEGNRLLAVVSVVPQVHAAAEALVAAGRRAGLRVLAAGPAEDAAALVPGADDTVPGGPELAASVRRLQKDGSGVLLLSRDRVALAAADVGIGITAANGAPPWGADLYAGDDPGRAVVAVEACGTARTVARRGVRLAQGAAGLGSAATLARRSPRLSARSLTAVNAAAGLGLAYGAWSAAELLRRPPERPAAQQPWHTMTPETVLARTGSTERGLTDRQADDRTGPSDDRDRHPSFARAVVKELANPLTPILAGGAALSAAVGGVLDAGIILAVTGLSGLIGGTQRHVTDRAVERLHQRSAVSARVVRDGQGRTVPAEDLVVGDIVNLATGDVVPADCRLLESHGVEADESALTGESMPVAKAVEPVLAADLADRTSMVYEGTSLAAGRARAVVVATGEATEAGRGARAGRGAPPPVGVERRLAQISRSTLPVALGSAGAVVAAGLLRGRPARETVGAGVGLAVASVPEGLPFLVSAAQLAAARRLSEQGVLVRDPRTIEAAGRADVLCFDKTGTLTQGRIDLGAVAVDGRSVPLDRLGPQERVVLAAGLRATPRPRGSAKLEHFTDRAVVAGAETAGVARDAGARGWRRSTSLPFEPSRGFHATRGRGGRRSLLSVKGAPEEVVERCATRGGRPLDRAAKDGILVEGEKLAAEGHRVLAVAEREGAPGGKLTDDAVDGLDFLGFLALTDQVRGTAARSVRQLAEAGVHIVMITGDHPQTAESIARELDVLDGGQVVTGAELDALDDDALDELLPRVGVVARGTPAHKVRVVQAFQRLGRTVAMTGDGANDAPAIRLADVGIALGGRGAPAARAAADLVVTDDRLETILAALTEGRAMWASVRQALAILVGGNLGEIGFTVVGATITGSSPLTARQLLLVNLFTDLAPAIAVALRPPAEGAAERLLREGPEASLGTALTDEITVRAIATALGAGLGWLAARATGRAVRARTVALAALVGSQLGQTLLVGGRSPAVLAASVGSMAALAAVIQTPGVSRFFGCTPLGPVAWTIALAAATAATAGSLLLPPVAGRVRTGLEALRSRGVGVATAPST